MNRVLIELEYFFKSSVQMVFDYVSTPEGLTRWFCNNLIIKDHEYQFYWEGAFENATLIDFQEDEKIVFHWETAESNSEYLEFNVSKSPITNETVLQIKEFCNEDEVEDNAELWDSQIDELKKLLGG